MRKIKNQSNKKNPVVQALKCKIYRGKVVQSKKIYTRKGRQKWRPFYSWTPGGMGSA
jgi:hypothetical protein